jgi:hypothetical protein
MERILLYCKATCHNVENSSEKIVLKKNHIPRNIRILECYFHLL